MRNHGFTDERFENQSFENKAKADYAGATVRDLKLAGAVTIDGETTCHEAIDLMEQNGFDQLPVTAGPRLGSGRATGETFISKIMFHFTHKSDKFEEIIESTPLDKLIRFFETHSSALVTEEQKVKHVVTKVDLLSYLAKNTKI